jgi:hypothetical protein
MKIRRRCFRGLILSTVALLSLVIVPAASGIHEPAPARGGPAVYAQVVAGGRQVEVVGPPQNRCQGGPGPRLQIRATLSQASTGAFGEGTLDVACPQGGPLTVYAAPGAPPFRDGTAQASFAYPSVHGQWLGELTLVGRLPSDNPLATSFRDRLGAPTTKSETDWTAVVVGVVVALAIGALVGVAVGRRRPSAAS